MKLYLVSTPIGNLSDITLRAIETLKNVDLILAEDKRVTHKLLDHFDIHKDIWTYNQYSSDAHKDKILKYLLDNKTIALVTDAGTPGISDPGNELIDYLYAHTGDQLTIVPIPGPSSITAALSISGFKSDKFTFLGFFPKKGKTKTLKFLTETDHSTVFFESPYRILKTVQLLTDSFPNKRIFVARELTKMFETIYRGTTTEVLSQLKSQKNLKGEYVIIIE